MAAPAPLPWPCWAAFGRASVSPSHRGRQRGAARQRKSRGATSRSTVPLVLAWQDAARSQCPPLLLPTKNTRRGPPDPRRVLSAHGLSSPGRLQVPIPAGCPRPRGGCAGTPGSYSQSLELGTGLGTFLNRGLWFTCTGAGGGPSVPSPGRGGTELSPRHKALGVSAAGGTREPAPSPSRGSPPWRGKGTRRTVPAVSPWPPDPCPAGTGRESAVPGATSV